VARPKAIVPVSMERNFARFCLYGQPSSGKSVLVGTSPKCLILANDSEEPLSAARFGSTADMWVIETYDDLDKAYEYVRHEGVNDYDWVWIDNATLFQEQGMDDIMADLFVQKPNSTQSRWVPDRPQYLLNQNKLGRMIRQFKALPIHFGITAHEMVVEWADGSDNLMPMLHGQAGQYSQKICGYMNIIGYQTGRTLKGGKFETKVRFQRTSRIYAKDRYSALGVVRVNPTMPELMEDIVKVLPTFGQRVKPRPAGKKTARLATKTVAAKRAATTTRKKAS
jgi:hypothetical protein